MHKNDSIYTPKESTIETSFSFYFCLFGGKGCIKEKEIIQWENILS